MPLPDDRLQELRRQRALVQEHLAWLDGQITTASGHAAPAPPSPAIVPPPAAEIIEAEAILESYRAESLSMPAVVRRGVIIAVAVLLVLFALCVFALYLYVRSHQSPVVR